MFALVLTTLFVSACGYHLQGALAAPPEMNSTYIDAIDDHSLFYRELRLQFEAAGIQIVDSPSDATAVCAIRLDKTDQRVLSVAARKPGVNSNRLTDPAPLDALSGNAVLNGIPVSVSPVA